MIPVRIGQAESFGRLQFASSTSGWIHQYVPVFPVIMTRSPADKMTKMEQYGDELAIIRVRQGWRRFTAVLDPATRRFIANEEIMKTFFYSALALVILVAFSLNLRAQTDDQAKPTKAVAKSTVTSCGCCVQGGAPQTSPIILALDLDKDGEISALEIKNATQSLAALDANNDGRLNRDEMHADTKFSNINASTKSNLQMGVSLDSYVKHVMVKYDQDGNGQLERSEMPERILSVLDMIDSNGDEILTKVELRSINEQVKKNYAAKLDAEKKKSTEKKRTRSRR